MFNIVYYIMTLFKLVDSKKNNNNNASIINLIDLLQSVQG